VSDDEDDTHPNIDTPSLFRWRHQARVERMEDTKKQRDSMDSKLKEKRQELESLRGKLKNTVISDSEGVTKKLQKAEQELKSLKKEDEELSSTEKKEPKNVDTLSHEGFTKTIINKPKVEDNEPVTEEEQAKRSKEALMERVAHQCIVMQYLLELAKQLHSDPKATVPSFFSKIVRAKSEFPEYIEAFNDELVSFKQRVKERAQARIEKATKEAEEQERQERLGPGGLDPVEVFESLPKELQDCFEKKDIPLLQECFSKMPEEEARKWLKQCVDSGLWIPNAEDAKKKEEGSTEDEKTYEEVKEPSS
ncbi:hypothetical protein QZH41_020397, partial [Actinostola sp. cb2023]